MVDDIRLAVNGKKEIEHYGRMGGMTPTVEELVSIVE